MRRKQRSVGSCWSRTSWANSWQTTRKSKVAAKPTSRAGKKPGQCAISTAPWAKTRKQNKIWLRHKSTPAKILPSNTTMKKLPRSSSSQKKRNPVLFWILMKGSIKTFWNDLNSKRQSWMRKRKQNHWNWSTTYRKNPANGKCFNTFLSFKFSYRKKNSNNKLIN